MSSPRKPTSAGKKSHKSLSMDKQGLGIVILPPEVAILQNIYFLKYTAFSNGYLQSS